MLLNATMVSSLAAALAGKTPQERPSAPKTPIARIIATGEIMGDNIHHTYTAYKK